MTPANRQSDSLEPEDLDALKEQAAKMQGVLANQIAPAVEAARKAMQLDPAVFASIRATLAEGTRAATATRLLPTLDLPAMKIPKTTQDYILEAQYDTIGAIESMGGLMEQSLEVQARQIEVLDDLRHSADQQTKLTRLVLGFAIAAMIVSILGVAATVAVAFLA